jgi:hypothetical protein
MGDLLGGTLGGPKKERVKLHYFTVFLDLTVSYMSRGKYGILHKW